MTGAAQSFETLVGTALLGTSRKPLDDNDFPEVVAAATSSTPETDPAARLLDAAAMLSVYHRAGATAPGGAVVPDAAPPETTRPLPLAALQRLLDLTRTAEIASEWLLELWLGAAARAGFHLPGQLLPALLDRGVRRRHVGLALVPVLGERGRWLAAQRSDWNELLLAAAPPAPPAAGSVPGHDWSQDPVWTHGSPAERRTWFTDLRRENPDAARDLLLDLDWAKTDGGTRASFVSSLAHHVSEQDEPLLEQARADRRQDVRTAAIKVLALLPDSSYVQQLTAFALPCLAIRRVGLRRTLVVTLPGASPDLDALPAPPHGPRERRHDGPGATRLRLLLSVVPLQRFEQALGATPADLVNLQVSDDLAGVVQAGWDAAAIRQHDAGWAIARVTAQGVFETEHLLRVVPEAQRQALVSAALPKDPGGGLGVPSIRIADVLRTCHPPWTPGLVASVLHWLARSAAVPDYVPQPVLTELEHALPADPGTEQSVRQLSRRQPSDSRWHEALSHVADTLLYRRQMLEELR